MISAAPMSVRCVPMSGMVMRAGTNVPMRLPAVESANTRPATRPASCTPVAARRMANGVTIPSSTTGGANRARDAAKDPTTAPVESVSMPLMERSRNGRATKGMRATHAAAASTMPASREGDGRRSARRPPTQYPTDSEARIRPMMLAHTTVDEP